MASELIFRGHESQPVSDSYSPKPAKPWLGVTRPIRYLLREQRLLFLLAGVAIAALAFSAIPPPHPRIADSLVPSELTRTLPHRSMYQNGRLLSTGFGTGSVGKIPLGLKRRGLRIVVTGGAGFVGSHLVDRLIARGDSVIVVDNFFTGRKENVAHHFGNPRFELIRHDVVEPLLLEVDQIYHLACPASPVHYKHNPTNVVGTLNMLGLAKRVGARFLLTSTSEVYGDPLQHPQVETYWGNVNPIGGSDMSNGGLLMHRCVGEFYSESRMLRVEDVKRGRGRPKLTWEESVKRDLKDWNIFKDLAVDRSAWRLAINVPEP
ncbi:UDP-xylose synthase 4 [Striga asiatica]|uniref:UDP-glucuronic acid decarboxylase 1 n=1 Tax=Striga asiatica TaxID=4170 RepID=A0A5A7NWB5_STRAF|nr:UDP-xylose synthase 4 [Striga asiatica]